MELNLSPFVCSADNIAGERDERLKLKEQKLARFGNKFLDEAGAGISPRDFIVLGAKAGIGKTEMAVNIAFSNVLDGRKVYYFALEAEDKEVERRIKFKMIAFYSRIKGLNFQEWMLGRQESLISSNVEEMVNKVLQEKLRNLHVRYRTMEEFTVDNFQKDFYSIEHEADLVIVDHLHYFDFDDKDENRAIKRIVKKIRDTALIASRPVIMVAHLRKSDKANKQILPELEDFHGTSEITKMATKVITFAPAYDRISSQPWFYPTYMKYVKNRFHGAVSRYTACIDFNAELLSYEPEYKLGIIPPYSDTWSELEFAKHPYWYESKPRDAF